MVINFMTSRTRCNLIGRQVLESTEHKYVPFTSDNTYAEVTV